MLGTSNGNNNSKILNGWELTRASVDGLVKAIESGRNEAFSNYLQTMARFHNYSARNVLLIAAQRPTATHLEGVRSWNELGRFVRPGEKGIFIFAPMIGITEKASNGSKAEEPVKKAPKGKKAAQPASTEPAPTQTETQLLGFRGVYVFDIEQTGGEDLPQSSKPFNVSEKLALLLAFAKSQQMTIEYADWIAPNKTTSYRGVIRLLPKMEPAEEFTALLRALASQVLFNTRRRTFVTRALHQQETKAAAFVVCEALGLTDKTAFSDCQLYYGDSRLLGESLQIVHRTAAAILRAINPEDGALSKSVQGVQ
jgi:N-terminal domain of anti-restriction factor ArdC